MHPIAPPPSAESFGPRPTEALTAPRLIAVDFFRGLALVFVLLDHLDWSAGPILIRRWTPIGLGFSDGAEAFVFLSGLTFGWVYSARLLRDGLRRSLVKVLHRVLQIYIGYVITLLLIAALSNAPIFMTDWTRNALRTGDGMTFSDALLRMLRMEAFPFGIDILGLYIVLLPCMLLLLVASQRARWIVLALSITAYVAVQPPLGWSAASPSWLSEWFFHPLAWQFIFLLGMLIGEHLRRTQSSVPRNAVFATIAAALVAFGLVYGLRREVVGLTGVSDRAVWEWGGLSKSWLVAKPRLGPVRVVHFLSVAYLAAYCLPEQSRLWNIRWLKPVIHTGRHSLPLYCFGTLLVYSAALPFYWYGNSPAVVIVVAVDACLLQFALAWWLEQRRIRIAATPKVPAGAVTSPPDAA